MLENSENQPEENETMEKIAGENFTRWNETLLTEDPEKVAALYAASSTFLPTMSGELKTGRLGATEYFKHFLEQKPNSEIIQEKIQPLGDAGYVHSGRYDFEVGPEHNRKKVEARFTFIWQRDDAGAWTIIHHHSSIKPKG